MAPDGSWLYALAMDLLGVVEGVTTTTLLSGNRAETSEHRFLDWTVNGRLLRAMLGWVHPPGECTCMVSGWDLDAGLAWLRSLSRDDVGGFPDGRAAILVCQECGDLECGALSARVTRGVSTVHWSHFGWQVPSEEGFEPLDVRLQLEFAAEDYDRLLSSLAQRLKASAVTVRASGRFRRKTEEQVVIRI